MIRASFKFSENRIVSFEIKGHANLSDYGTDIVCSAVSSTCIMCLNGILEYLRINIPYQMKEGYTSCELKDINDERVNTLTYSFYLMIKQINEQYPKNLKLEVMEV